MNIYIHTKRTILYYYLLAQNTLRDQWQKNLKIYIFKLVVHEDVAGVIRQIDSYKEVLKYSFTRIAKIVYAMNHNS